MSNVARQYVPMAGAYVAGHLLEGGPLAGGAAAMATRSILPAAQRVVPHVNPWWNQVINAGVQGPLSGQLAGQTP